MSIKKTLALILAAAMLLGLCAGFGKRPEEQDKAKAFDDYVQAAEKGEPDAQYAVGDFYENGHGVVDVDLNQAAAWYEKAAE